VVVSYQIEYHAHGEKDEQPAEEFEDALERSAPKLLGKLQGIASRVADQLPSSIGGGLWEKCRGYPDLWEVRTIFARQLARYIAALDGQHEPPRLVLLAGVFKHTGEPTPQADLERAARCWAEYKQTGMVSPADEEESTS
jgi:hypothetical protein